MESCAKHPHEIGVALCGRCGVAWCANCLVYTHGQRKPPFCLECAMFAGGVRSAAVRPALSRKQMKARLKEVEVAAAATAEPALKPTASAVEVDPAERSPLTETTDWSSPWWEERQPTLTD